MKNNSKYLNLFIKNLDKKKLNNNINYQSNLSSNKIIKNKSYNLNFKKDIISEISNFYNFKEKINPLNNNQIEKYLESQKKNVSNLIFNNEIKNHISLGKDTFNNKKETSYKIKPKKIYNNKSEIKMTILKDNKIYLNDIQNNNNNITSNKIYQNNSEKFFPILYSKNLKNQKKIKKEKNLNINSARTIDNPKITTKKNLIGKINFNLLNNKLSKNDINPNPNNKLFSNNKNFLKSTSIYNNKKFKKKMVKLFTDSNVMKRIINNESLLKVITPSVYIHSDNNIQSNPNSKNKLNNINDNSSEYILNKKIKKYLLDSKKNKDENKIKDDNNIKKNIFYHPKNKIYNIATINSIKTIDNQLNHNRIKKIKEKNFDNKIDISSKELFNIKNLKGAKNENNLIINNKEIKQQSDDGIINNSKSNISQFNQSIISNSKSSIYDFNYYMNESDKISEYIKSYYKKNKKYPSSKINFYKFGRKIGQGAFGKVNIGLHILSGRIVAIKSFIKKNCSKKRLERILNERNLMKELNNKNIIKILDYFEDGNYIFIVMEYINGGDLYTFIRKRIKLEEKMAKFIFKQIISTIDYYHGFNIVHRDIKLENILLDLNHGIKICDFGLGKKLKSSEELLTGVSGTPSYMAPEIILSDNNSGYKGFPIDIWSSGIALYIMLCGKLPFKKNKINNDEKLDNPIINEEPKEIVNISDEAKDLIKGLLCKDPTKRLTCKQILNHPWLNNIRNNDYSCQLFTDKEMIMLSQTYIDYRKDKNENLKEYFNINNLYNEEENSVSNFEKIKNNQSKSIILTPFNSMNSIHDNYNEMKDKDDILNDNFKNIKIEDDILEIGNKIKEYYRLYEQNNNNEIDNGIMIYNQLNSNSLCNSSNTYNFDLNKKKMNNKKLSNDKLNNNNFNNIEIENIRKKEKVLNELEHLGYDKEYILKCLKNNEINYGMATYFLLLNYDDIN